MRRMLTVVFALALTSLLSGCYKYVGTHILMPYGVTDRGDYEMTLNPGVWEAMSEADRAKLMQIFQKVSDPVTRWNGSSFVVEDKSGYARMEKQYDSVECRDMPDRRFVDCRYRLTADNSSLLGWSFSWTVVAPQNIQIVNSNAARTSQSYGNQTLEWYFSDPTNSRVDIWFEVITPRR